MKSGDMLVLSGFVRVATHPKLFTRPNPLADALEFTEQLRSRPNCVPVAPVDATGPSFAGSAPRRAPKATWCPMRSLPAIEAGCEWVTTDRDFSRFNGLRWRHPVQ
jgi:predicted nucleic acid-binding protein